MIKILLLLLSINLSFADSTFWNNMSGKWGIGLSLGSPTGISSNFYLSEVNSLDMMIGYDFDGNFNFHSDFLINLSDAYNLDKLDMNLYYGAGLRVQNQKNGLFLFGPRATVGTSHYFNSVPLEIGVEIAGIFSFVEETDFDMEAFLNLRYYF